jgi:hypothetical protein
MASATGCALDLAGGTLAGGGAAAATGATDDCGRGSGLAASSRRETTALDSAVVLSADPASPGGLPVGEHPASRRATMSVPNDDFDMNVLRNK